MTKRWSHIAIVALSSLTFTTSAQAECAWVLWGQEGTAPWEIMEAFEKKATCDAKASKSEAMFSALNQKAKKPKFYSVQCFPDTIDPRGPKGK